MEGRFGAGQFKTPSSLLSPQKDMCLVPLSFFFFNHRHSNPLTQSAETRSLDLLTAVKLKITFALLSGSVPA